MVYDMLVCLKFESMKYKEICCLMIFFLFKGLLSKNNRQYIYIYNKILTVIRGNFEVIQPYNTTYKRRGHHLKTLETFQLKNIQIIKKKYITDIKRMSGTKKKRVAIG